MRIKLNSSKSGAFLLFKYSSITSIDSKTIDDVLLALLLLPFGLATSGFYPKYPEVFEEAPCVFQFLSVLA